MILFFVFPLLKKSGLDKTRRVGIEEDTFSSFTLTQSVGCCVVYCPSMFCTL